MHRPAILSLLLACTALLPSASPADTYVASEGFSYVVFKTKHFGVSNAHGRFNKFKATVEGDHKDIAKAKLRMVIEANSVDTGIEKRDIHLRNADFFNAKEFPEIVFESTSIQPVEGKENEYLMEGKLTMLGVTKPVKASFTYFGEGKDPKQNPIWGAESIFTIKRSDWGMNYGIGGIGDEVTLTVSLQARKE